MFPLRITIILSNSCALGLGAFSKGLWVGGSLGQGRIRESSNDPRIEVIQNDKGLGVQQPPYGSFQKSGAPI